MKMEKGSTRGEVPSRLFAGGKGEGLLFRKGTILRKVPQEQLVDALMAEIEKMTADLHRN